MKKKLKTYFPQRSLWLRGLCLGLCLLTATVGMVGCSRRRGNHTTETTETQAATEVVTYPVTEPPSPETESLSDTLKAYYESLIQELREELLQEREDRYISDHEYKTRLEELEAALKAWEEAAKEEDKPTAGEPDTQPPETQPEETMPPVSSAPFDYRLENGQVIITAYKGKESSVTIPTEIDGYPVTAIDDHAFQNTSVISVIIPGSVTSVGWFAFYGCFGLEIVAIPSSVTSISYAAFDGCPNLTLLCPSDSYAARYAVSFGLKHEYV